MRLRFRLSLVAPFQIRSNHHPADHRDHRNADPYQSFRRSIHRHGMGNRHIAEHMKQPRQTQPVGSHAMQKPDGPRTGSIPPGAMPAATRPVRESPAIPSRAPDRPRHGPFLIERRGHSGRDRILIEGIVCRVPMGASYGTREQLVHQPSPSSPGFRIALGGLPLRDLKRREK